MVHFILGQAGTGKTTLLQQQAAQAAKQGKRVLVLVPEQYSFETERAMYEQMGFSYSAQMEVLSFSRLAELIFREYGGLAGRYVDDSARHMLMSITLQELRDSLELYSARLSGSAMLTAMVEMVGEFKNAGIPPEELREQGKTIADPILRGKVEELSLIYTLYQSLLEKSFADQKDDLIRACRLLEGRDFFKGCSLFFDSFKGFMFGEFRMLEQMLSGAQDVTFAFCCNGLYDSRQGTGVFSPVQETIGRLLRMAAKLSVPVASPVMLDVPKRFETPELAHLSHQLFAPTPQPFEELCEAVQVVRCENPYDQLEYVASAIWRLVRGEGLRFRDVAVIGRSMEELIPPLESIFEKYEIPYFMDRRLDIEGQPLPSLVLTALEAVRGSGLDTDSVIRLSKSPLLGVSSDDAAMLDNYCYTWRIGRGQWGEAFQEHPDGFGGSLSLEEAERLERIEAARQRIAEPLFRLSAKIESCDGEGFARAVYEYLEETGATQRLWQQDDPWSPQLWDKFVDLLDQTAGILKGVRFPKVRFGELLRLGLQSCEIALIPQTMDQVTVGAADRIRPGKPKAVFLIGVNQGEFPAKIAGGGLLSDSERQLLTQSGLELSETAAQRAVGEKYFAYAAALSPSRRLYLCHTAADMTGGAKAPSVLLEQIERIFPNRQDEQLREAGGLCDPEPFFRVVNEKTALEGLCRRIGGEKPLPGAAALARLLENRPSGKRLPVLEGLLQEQGYLLTDLPAAKRLFGERLVLSPSKVEAYESCPFLYFCQYALRLKKRSRAELSPLESGSVIHFVLAALLAGYTPEQLNAMEQDVLQKLIADALKQYLEQVLVQKSKRPARFDYLYSRLQSLLQKLVNHLVQELCQSRFRPVGLELPIAGRPEAVEPLTLKLAGGGTVTVEGVVDRVDLLTREDGSKYIRVIDYKSGSKKFRLSEVYQGLNLQMLLYLFTLCEKGKGELEGVLPAGVLYLPARAEPVSAFRDEAEAGVQQQFTKNFRMDGLVLDDPEVINAMEPGAKGVYIPVKSNKDGSLSRGSSVASLAHLGRLREHVEQVIIKMGESLMAGNIDNLPAESPEFTPCGWCDYQAGCGREENSSKRRELCAMSDQEVFRLLGDDSSGKGEC